MRRMGNFWAVCGLLLMSGCSMPMTLSLYKDVDPYADVAVPEGKGLVYLYRDQDYMGCVRGFWITANGAVVGGLNNGTYFVYASDPGAVSFAVKNNLGSDMSRTLDVESGKKYFLKGSIKVGLWDAVPAIEIMSEAEGSQAVKSLTYAVMDRPAEIISDAERQRQGTRNRRKLAEDI